MDKKILEREQRCNRLKTERECEVSAYFGGLCIMFTFFALVTVWIMMG